MQKLNIIIIGGAGFIGRTLSSILLDAGHKITVLSRTPVACSFFRNGITVLHADVLQPGSWQEEMSDFDVVINLSGASIFRRWTTRGKQEILNSRILTTRNIVEAIKRRRGNVRQFISVSGVGVYGFHGDEFLDENDSAGSDFIAQVAARWEYATQPVNELGVRLVICRLGHVLGMNGGALPKLATLARLHLGSYWGSGNQWISWVHEEDLARAVLFLLDTHTISGPVNITSPNPVRNREMMQVLTKILGERVVISHIPKFALQLMLGQFSSVFVNGQKVMPAILKKRGFIFKFPILSEALNDLLKPYH
ncbi:TIGR01777 family oxidoreductase [Chloroflexota bacterium]